MAYTPKTAHSNESRTMVATFPPQYNSSPMNFVLTSERLLLMPLSATDVDIAIEMFTDPAVVKYVCKLMSEVEIRTKIPGTYLRRQDSAIGAEFGHMVKTVPTFALTGKNGLK